jgi:hypothetical protein
MKKKSVKVIPKGVTDITMACFEKGTTIRKKKNRERNNNCSFQMDNTIEKGTTSIIRGTIV